jgi:hypothetical protein
MRSENIHKLFSGLGAATFNEGTKRWSEKEIRILQAYIEHGDFGKMIQDMKNHLGTEITKKH